MRAARWWILVVAVAGLGCGKKGPEQAAPSPDSGKYLPADAAGYLEIDVKSLMASSLIQPLRDKLVERIPAPCRPLAERTERMALTLHGSAESLLGGMFAEAESESRVPEGEGDGVAKKATPPMPGMALLFKGPAAADLRACLEGLAREGDPPIREEDRNGRKVLLGGRDDQFAVVSPTESIHVMCTMPQLDAVLAAMAGGPSIESSDLVPTMATMSAGAIIGAMKMPESIAELMADGLEKFSGGKPVPVPLTAALSVGVGDSIAIAAAMTFSDEAGAQRLLEIATGLIGTAKAGLAMAGADKPELAPYKRALDSLSLARSGATLTARIVISGDLLKSVL